MAKIDIAVVGTSAGGMQALGRLLTSLPREFAVPLVVVQHLSPESNDYLPIWLQKRSKMAVVEAQHGALLCKGTSYIAPAAYHLLFEDKLHLALSADAPYRFSRPSIDVTFVSAAMVFGAHTAAVVLTGANDDGAQGARRIEQAGGRILVQSPDDAEVATMPRATLAVTSPSQVAPIESLARTLIAWSQEP